MTQKFLEPFGFIRVAKFIDHAHTVLVALGTHIDNISLTITDGLLSQGQLEIETVRGDPIIVARFKTPVSQGVARIRWELQERELVGHVEVFRKETDLAGETRWHQLYEFEIDASQDLRVNIEGVEQLKIDIDEDDDDVLAIKYAKLAFNIFYALVNRAT